MVLRCRQREPKTAASDAPTRGRHAAQLAQQQQKRQPDTPKERATETAAILCRVGKQELKRPSDG